MDRAIREDPGKGIPLPTLSTHTPQTQTHLHTTRPELTCCRPPLTLAALRPEPPAPAFEKNGMGGSQPCLNQSALAVAD